MRFRCSHLLLGLPLHAVEPTFPKLEEAKRIHGELVSADFNLTREQTDKPAVCTDLWVGEDTHKLVLQPTKMII